MSDVPQGHEPSSQRTGGVRRPKKRAVAPQCARCEAYQREVADLRQTIAALEARLQGADAPSPFADSAAPALPTPPQIPVTPPAPPPGGPAVPPPYAAFCTAPPTPTSAAHVQNPLRNDPPIAAASPSQSPGAAPARNPIGTPHPPLRTKSVEFVEAGGGGGFQSSKGKGTPDNEALSDAGKGLSSQLQGVVRTLGGDGRPTKRSSFRLHTETSARLRELESSLSNGSGLEREDKEARGSVHLTPLCAQDSTLNGDTESEELSLGEVLHPSRWILQGDVMENEFAVCTKAGLRFLYLHYSDGVLNLSAEDPDRQDTWAFLSHPVHEEGYLIIHSSTKKYLCVEPVAGGDGGERSRRVTLSGVATDSCVWFLSLSSLDTNVFLYKHDIAERETEEDRAALAELKSVMPETYCTVSLIRNNAGPECTAQQLASNVLKSRAVMEWRRTAFLLIVISCFVESFDSVSDIRATIEYYQRDERTIALVSMCILAASGLIRGFLSFYIVLADSQSRLSTWTVGDVLIILLSFIPVPLADILEAVRVVQGLLAMDDAAFLVLKPVRTGRMQLRSAATSMAESFPQLCLQAYAFFGIGANSRNVTQYSNVTSEWTYEMQREERGNDYILVLSLLMSFIAILWSVIHYLFVIVIEERGPLLQVFDLSDKDLKKAIGQPSSIGLLHSMTGREFVQFVQCISQCSFGRLHFDDVQLIIDHARNLIEAWESPNFSKSGWIKKELYLGGCPINWHAVMDRCVARAKDIRCQSADVGDDNHLQVAVQGDAVNGMTSVDANDILSTELAKEILPIPTGLSVLLELALELNAECTALDKMFANAEVRSGCPFRGHVRGMRFFNPEIVFMGAVAGGRSLDRHGARYAAAMIRGQRGIHHVVLSGNRFGMAEEESPLKSYDFGRVTEETFRTLEAIGGCAVNGRCDISDFKSGFRLFPQLNTSTLTELFGSISSCDSEDNTISFAEWELFAQRYPKIVLALYHRLRSGISQLLSAVIFNSSLSCYRLECVDLRGCNLTNSELWSVARTCIVDNVRPVQFLIHGGNGSKGVDSFVQQVMDFCLEGLRQLQTEAAYSGDDPHIVAQNENNDDSSIDAKCVLEVSDLVRFSCTLVDHALRRLRISESARVLRLHLSLLSEVRVPDSVWEEQEESYLDRRTLLVVDNLLECQSRGVLVSWKARGLHGCVSGLLEAADILSKRRRTTRRTSDVQDVLHADYRVDLAKYHPRASDIPIVLRLNMCLWKRGLNASCTPFLRLEWKLIPNLISCVRVMLLRKASAIDTFELRADGMELLLNELEIAAEMVEGLSRSGVDVQTVIPLMSFTDCSLDTTHTAALTRLLRLGVRYCDLSGNNLGDPDLLQLLDNIPEGFSCLDLLRNPKLEGCSACVMSRVSHFREANPEIMLCLPRRHRTGNWTNIAGATRPSAAVVELARKLSAPIFAEDPDTGSCDAAAQSCDTIGLRQWRKAMRQMYHNDSSTAPMDAIVYSLGEWHSPQGTLYRPAVIQQLQEDCALVSKQWEACHPAEVVMPIYIFSTSLKRQYLWVLGVASSGHRFGLQWELLDSRLILMLEQSAHATAGTNDEGYRVELPPEKLEDLGLSVHARWVRDEVCSGLEVFSCGIAKLVRYENTFPGDAGRSPLHDTALWLPRPGTAFSHGSGTHYNNLPYPGIIEYVAQHLPQQCLGGRGWRSGRSSLEAACDPDGGYDWIATPVMNQQWCALAKECLAQLNPCEFDAKICSKLDKLLDSSDLEEVVLSGTFEGLGLQFKASHDEVILSAAPPEAQYFIGRRVHFVDNTPITTLGQLMAMGQEDTEHEFLFSFHRGHFRKLLRDLITQPLTEHAKGSEDQERMLTPAEISQRMQVHLVSFVRHGEKKHLLLGGTGRAGFVMATFVQEEPAQPFALQRCTDERFEQPEFVLNSTIQSLFDGKLESTLTHGCTYVAVPKRSKHGKVVFFEDDGPATAVWDPLGAFCMDTPDGSWLATPFPGGVPTRLNAQCVYQRNAWMLDQVRPFSQALCRALTAIDNRTALMHASHVQQDFTSVKYRVDPSLSDRCDVGSLAVWGTFSVSREGYLHEEVDHTVPHTVFMLKGRSCKFIAPWCRDTNMLESMFKFGTVWKVTAVLSRRQQYFMGQQAQQVVEMTELTRTQALFVYIEECIERHDAKQVSCSSAKAARGTLYDLLKYKLLVQAVEGEVVCDEDVMRTSMSSLLSMLYQLASCDALFAQTSFLPFTVEVMHQIVDLLLGMSVPLDYLHSLAVKLSTTAGSSHYQDILAEYTVASPSHLLSPVNETLQQGGTIPPLREL